MDNMPIIDFDFQDGFGPLNAGDGSVQLYIWIGLAVLIFIIQILMAVWVAKDAKRSGKSPGWAAFVIIPGIGLIGLFIYILIPGGPTPEEIAQQRMVTQLKQQVQQSQTEMQQIRSDAERRIAEMAGQQPLMAPVTRKGTMIIDAVPSRIISLTQIGGKNHGMTFSLYMKGPDGSVSKNRIGRNASCELSFPEDEGMSGEHCMILEDNDQICVIDLASANGTILERGENKGKINKKTPLANGDSLILGNVHLNVMIIEPKEAPEEIMEFEE